MTKLALAHDLDLPVRTVTEKLGFIGTTGAGKSYAATYLAELFWAQGAQFIVLDPVGVWYGLRLQADGKRPSSIQIPIFGGLHGDVPLEPTGGALVADLIVDKALSVIVDVSQFESDMDKARFAKAFADRFYFRKKAAPSAVHLFLEECQEFVPQNPQKGEEGMLHAFTRMQKLGRNFGIGSSYITQRPQEVNKKALNLAQTLFVFRTTGLHERKSIEAWIQDKGLDQNIVADLPKLSTGTCHVWSPEFLKVSKVIAVSTKETFNASATPGVGDKVRARELAPIDLERIKTDMAATIEKAKAEDPRELRNTISRLNHRIRDLEREAASKQVEKQEVPVLAATQVHFLDGLAQQVTEVSQRLIGALDETRKLVAKVVHPSTAPTRPAVVSEKRPIVSRKAPIVSSNGTRSQSQQRILNALAWAEGIGLDSLDKTQLALLADQSPTSGGYFNNLGALRTASLIGYPSAGTVKLTPDGRSCAEAGGIPTSSEELHEMLYQKLSGSQAAILRHVIGCYPSSISKQNLAEAIGQSATSGGYFNNLGRLRSLGLIEYPSPGWVQARRVLFLDR